MGKPRLIILVRHGQSEGNKNRDIHQFIPDHRVKLTPDGWLQAEEAGRRLRALLKPDDTLQFFTSPYRRARETTEGILRTLTSDDPIPSPFPRHKVKVYEEPRLREQDFGNFQPCSAEMERMWQERADYGHFFYRIPNGESAADAYDRISGFNESLWRQFGEDDFPSVCVLVTHGLMTRVFLMKWYHWSVEYFEDLRNVNHCEFIIMQRSPNNGKYILENQLRTWSDLKRRAAAANPNTNVNSGPPAPNGNTPIRRWGGCANGCNHDKVNFPRKVKRQNTADFLQMTVPTIHQPEKDGTSTPTGENENYSDHNTHPSIKAKMHRNPIISDVSTTEVEGPSNRTSTDAENGDASASSSEEAPHDVPRAASSNRPAALPMRLHPGRDFGGSRSGTATPAEGFFSDDSDFFPDPRTLTTNPQQAPPARSIAAVFGNGGAKQPSRARSSSRNSRTKGAAERRSSRKNSAKMEAEWVAESGMGVGARADALGDGDVEDSEVSQIEENSAPTATADAADTAAISDKHEPIAEGDEDQEEREREKRISNALDKAVEAEKMEDRKTFSEMRGGPKSNL